MPEKQVFVLWETQIWEIISLIVAAWRPLSFSYTFFEELNLCSSKSFVFQQKCPYFHNFDFEDLSKAISDFFSRELCFNWSHPLKILEPTTWKITSVNRCLVFQSFGFQISLYGASFQQNTAIVIHWNFLFFDILSFFYSVSLNWCSSIVLLHPWVTGVL